MLTRKLIDLEPHWVNIPQAADGVRFYIGVSFLCPHCDHTPCPTCGAHRGKRVAISFWPPIDPDGLQEKLGISYPHEHFARRLSGDTFETISIFERINFADHWSGVIRDGELI